jgi:hypothetical protein
MLAHRGSSKPSNRCLRSSGIAAIFFLQLSVYQSFSVSINSSRTIRHMRIHYIIHKISFAYHKNAAWL